ncbi:MAG: precorrin-2 C(20)-methyltransferase [Moraxellaceae bacterium]|nr:MAG: precorrin-2 C(20)-methyltransferase [Moraxellaceae bacterium]
MTSTTQSKAVFYGVGVGPGDPELITLKACRVIQNADVVVYITNAKGHSVGKTIASDTLLGSKATQITLPITISMSIERKAINSAYDKAADTIKTLLVQGYDVAFLCEGDPLFFGSFIYLMDRVSPSHQCKVIPGITSVNAASAQLATPLTMLSEDMAIISSRSDDKKIRDTLVHYDTVAILKAGPQLPRLMELLSAAKRLDDTQYIEYATHENERVVTDLSQMTNEKGPYFSLLLITRPHREYRCD